MAKKLFLICGMMVFLFTNVFAQSLIEQGDEFWAKRGENFSAEMEVADAGNIDQAIALYKQALNTEDKAQQQAATWKLVRAYHFKGNYTTNDSEVKKQIFDLGKNLGDKGVVDFPECAAMQLHTAIVWGLWGQEYGIMKAAKEGVAGNIKQYCEKSIELNPELEGGSAYRVLGRVYFKAPKIPFLLRWPSKDKAVGFLTTAFEMAPRNLTVQQFLAEALHATGKEDKALLMAQKAMEQAISDDFKVEDIFLKRDIAKLVADWE